MSTQRSTQRSTLVAAAVTLALSGQTATVLAAQSTNPGSNQQIEEVVVTGIRGSLRESLETKREAVGVVDALTAEDVGKFPDKNLAEALPAEYAGALLDDWRKRNPDKAGVAEMEAFVRERCPKWAGED